MEIDKLPNVKKYWINDGYLNIELKDNHRLRMNFNNIETIKEQLTLTDVVKSVLCIDAQGHSHITNGKTYNVVNEVDNYYRITDDYGYTIYYEKRHFE